MTNAPRHGFLRKLRFAGLMGFLLSGLVGCATNEAHYSRFEATNSAGEPRSFLLSWKTKRYPGWALQDDVATAVQLESQCSKRKWVLRDSSMRGRGMDDCEVDSRAGESDKATIRACGKPGEDLDRDGQPISQKGHACMTLTDERGSQSILELGSDVELSVACYPDETERQEGDETINTDYLNASVVPYSIRTRTAPLYSMNERPPELDDSVCADE